jgi:hypothetical protein
MSREWPASNLTRLVRALATKHLQWPPFLSSNISGMASLDLGHICQIQIGKERGLPLKDWVRWMTAAACRGLLQCEKQRERPALPAVNRTAVYLPSASHGCASLAAAGPPPLSGHSREIFNPRAQPRAMECHQ